MNLHELIYRLGTKYRNPSLIKYLKFLKDSDNWTLDKLEQYQLAKCKHLIDFAYKYSSFYKDEFDKIGFDPSDFKSLHDLKKLPIIDKNTLLKYNKYIQSNFKFKKLVFSETSGTSGQVLSFYRNEEWDSATRAAQYRGYSWYGVSPWERNGYFWGYNIDKSQRKKVELFDTLINRFRIFSYNKEDIQEFAKKLQSATYVEGYSSMIYEVAKIVNELKLSGKFNLKMVKGTSEKIYSSYQLEVEKAFGRKMINEYGSCETGIIAFECPNGNMHIAMENVIVEEIDGAAIVTNLMSDSFPIIRYNLGDVIKLAPNNMKCKCNRQHPIIIDVLGRVGKNIIGDSSKYPSLTFYYVFKNLALNKYITLNYQAIQNAKGIVDIKIEQNKPQHETDLRIELTKYFKNDIEFNIFWGAKLHSMNGKLKDFITTLE